MKNVKDIRTRIARLTTEIDILRRDSLINNLTKHIPGVVYQYRLYPDGRTAFPYASQGMYNIYELTPEEVRENALPVKDRIHPDDFDYVFNLILESARNQTVYECEFRVILPIQGLQWRYCSAKPELLEDGSTLWYGIINDITARKEIEQELEIKNRELNSFFDCALDLLCIADKEGRFVRLNYEWENVLGYQMHELLGKEYIDFVHPEDVESTIEAKDKLQDRIQITNYINRLRCKDGSFKWIEWRLFPSENRVYASARDITERIRTEEMLIKAKDKAEESDRLKTAFLNNMSHEIRTPMNAIMGFSSLLPKYYNDKVKLQHFTEIINQRCGDLLDIINDILDIAKIESNQMSLNLEACSLKSLFEELPILFMERVKLNKEHIRFEVKDRTGISDLKIITDYIKLKQILINLISNAFKFTDEGSVTVSYMIEGDKIKFCISDTGIGIPLERQHLVFGRFSNLQDDKTKLYDGAGLGLPIAKGLTNILGGKVWFNSEAGKGSTFYFTIRYVRFSLPEEDEIIGLCQNKNQADRRVLVVENDQYYSVLLHDILADKGLNLVFVDNAADAIRIASKDPPNLVLLDVGLPDISGYEAATQILLKNPAIKIIAQTAGLEESQIALRNAGCIDCISKPVESKELFSVLKKYI
ncbi:MAG TPA: PAS domain-containing protein [Bacteroidales bacterium]|nr:PAS domain-containing protein [Bacteroidales bacterium]